MIGILIFVYLFNIYSLRSQNVDIIFPDKPRFLNFSGQLPKDLFSGRAAVFVNSPCGTLPRGQKNWKQIAGEMHTGLRKAGIDAVAYFHGQDIFSGQDASAAFAADLKKRDIKNLIFIGYEKNDQTPTKPGNYTLIITPFNGEPSFVSHNQEAYKLENSDPSFLLNELYKLYANSSLEKSNYLIIDRPEFFEDTQVNKGKRFEIFLSDLKIDNLAVPKFEVTEAQDSKSEEPFNKKVDVKLQELNEEAARNNERLEGILASYPFQYELVDPMKAEDQLRKAGFQYILLRIKTSEKTIRDLLNYSSDKEADARIQTLNGSKGEPVYKYYIKHIYSGDIYLGTGWDAAPSWDTALENHIYNLRKELKVDQ